MEHVDYRAQSRRRLYIQSFIWLIVIITIFGGLKYPLLGFVVAGVMMMGVIGALIKGRYVCGWLCPRGALFDRVIKPVSAGRGIPQWLRDYRFRWAVFASLMGFMAFQISRSPGDAQHWGQVFVRTCIITTGIGVLLAVFLHPRAWCAFCPMGTLQSAVGGQRAPLYVEDGCKGCRTCEKACPMDLRIVGNATAGRLDSRDCLSEVRTLE